jgi:methyl-accepting chemotaxis protein
MTGSLSRVAGDLAQKFEKVAHGAERMADGMASARTTMMMGAAAVGVLVKITSALDAWSKRSGEAMKRMEESSKRFAEITGSSTWAQKMAAAKEEAGALAKRFEEMGGNTYSHGEGWTVHNAWEQLLDAIGAGSNEEFDALGKQINNMNRFTAWLQKQGDPAQKIAYLSFADVTRSMQKSIVEGEELVRLTKEGNDILYGIQRKLPPPAVTR